MKRILKKVTSLETSLRFFDINGELTDVSNLTGDVSNLRGNVDDAEISEEDRKKGVDVSDLIIAE